MTGFRFNIARVKKRLAKVGEATTAAEFRGDVEKFVADTLQTCIKITPVRSVSLIESNQRKQFHDRARYIKKFPDSRSRIVTESQFIKERAQARFLYRKSWKQCADSAKVRVHVSPAVAAAVTRRRPAVQPPRGYAIWRGGKETLSCIIRNPFLNIPSQYKKFDAQQIMDRALAVNRAAFKRSTQNHIRRAIYAASRS